MSQKRRFPASENDAIRHFANDDLVLLHTSQVARVLGVESETVRRLVARGDLEVHSRTTGRHARYRLQDVLAYKAKLERRR